MKKNYISTLLILLILVVVLTISGVSAKWVYLGYPAETDNSITNTTVAFKYGTMYITEVKNSGGSYQKAEPTKIADLDISTDIKLNANASSTAVIEVTFYNNTDVSYYYNEAETVSHDNDRIIYTVSGIKQKDEIPSKTFKTIYLTYTYGSNNISNSDLVSTIHFSFVVDKESIGDIVAQTAIDRFRDILNNKVAPDSYDTLDNAMNNRSGINKASAVTYIGNVSGSSNTDSKVIESLFGQEFMSMDLDGDGKAEPITMMIKRENLDEDSTTGASYTYTSWGRKTTVDGVEMTIYITSENLDNISSNKDVVVYSAVFTKYSANEEWVQIVPLTKGTAKANNYSGYGSANSFNTDTWVSNSNQGIEELVADNLKK